MKTHLKQCRKRGAMFLVVAGLFAGAPLVWAGGNDIQKDYHAATKAAREAGTMVAELEKFIDDHENDPSPMTKMLIDKAKEERDRVLYEALRYHPAALAKVKWLSSRFGFLFDPANREDPEPPRFVEAIDTPLGSAVEAFRLNNATIMYWSSTQEAKKETLMPPAGHHFVGVVFAHLTTDELFDISREHFNLTIQSQARTFPCVGWTFHWVVQRDGKAKKMTNSSLEFKMIKNIRLRLLFDDRRPVRHVLLFLVPNEIGDSSLYLWYDDKSKNPAGIPPQLSPLRWPKKRLLTPPEMISGNRAARLVTDGPVRLTFLPWRQRADLDEEF